MSQLPSQINDPNSLSLKNYLLTNLNAVLKNKKEERLRDIPLYNKLLSSINQCTKQGQTLQQCIQKYAPSTNEHLDRTFATCIKLAFPAKQGSEAIIDKCIRDFDEQSTKEHQRLKSLIQKNIQ